jgi:hypothetical protein
VRCLCHRVLCHRLDARYRYRVPAFRSVTAPVYLVIFFPGYVTCHLVCYQPACTTSRGVLSALPVARCAGRAVVAGRSRKVSVVEGHTRKTDPAPEEYWTCRLRWRGPAASAQAASTLERTVCHAAGERKKANLEANNGKERKDLYTDNWAGAEYQGNPVNTLSVIVAVSLLVPLLGIAFAYLSYGKVWG